MVTSHEAPTFFHTHLFAPARFFFADDDRDVFWDLYQRGETGPLEYPTNAAPLDIALTRSMVWTTAALVGPGRVQLGRHATRLAALAADARGSWMSTLARASTGLTSYAAALGDAAKALSDPVKGQPRGPANQCNAPKALRDMSAAASDARRIVISASAEAAGVHLTDGELRALTSLDVPGFPGISESMREWRRQSIAKGRLVC